MLKEKFELCEKDTLKDWLGPYLLTFLKSEARGKHTPYTAYTSRRASLKQTNKHEHKQLITNLPLSQGVVLFNVNDELTILLIT